MIFHASGNVDRPISLFHVMLTIDCQSFEGTIFGLHFTGGCTTSKQKCQQFSRYSNRSSSSSANQYIFRQPVFYALRRRVRYGRSPCKPITVGQRIYSAGHSCNTPNDVHADTILITCAHGVAATYSYSIFDGK